MGDFKEEQDLSLGFFIFVFIAIVYYIFRRNAGDYFINKGIVEIFVVAMIILAGQTVIWVSRYFMPHVAVNGFSGSILGRPTILKDTYGVEWCVFNTGDALQPFYMRGKLATLIVPKSQVNKAGRNYVAKTFVKQTPVTLIPPVVYRYLQHSPGEYNMHKVYFGKFSEKFIHDDPKVAEYEAHIQNLQKQINLRDDLLEGRNDELVEMKKFAEEMSGSKRKWYEIFHRKEEADRE